MVASAAAAGTAGRIVVPRRGQAALGEDHDQRGEAERLRHLLVVELQADRVLAQQQAEPEIEQQRRQPAAHRQPHRGDGDEQHDGADEQQHVELCDGRTPLLPPTGYPSFRMAGSSGEPDDLARGDDRRHPAVVRLRRYGDGRTRRRTAAPPRDDQPGPGPGPGRRTRRRAPAASLARRPPGPGPARRRASATAVHAQAVGPSGIHSPPRPGHSWSVPVFCPVQVEIVAQHRNEHAHAARPARRSTRYVWRVPCRRTGMQRRCARSLISGRVSTASGDRDATRRACSSRRHSDAARR